jgi:hypothetical protein
LQRQYIYEYAERESDIYLDKKHNNSKENLCDLSQKINTNWAKIEFPIDLGHID